MDLNGPQKIEIFKKLDPLHVKKNSSKKLGLLDPKKGAFELPILE